MNALRFVGFVNFLTTTVLPICNACSFGLHAVCSFSSETYRIIKKPPFRIPIPLELMLMNGHSCDSQSLNGGSVVVRGKIEKLL